MKTLNCMAFIAALASAAYAADDPDEAAAKAPTAKAQPAKKLSSPQTVPALPKSPEKWIGVMAGPLPEPVRAQLSNVPENQGLIIFNIAKESPAVVAGLEKFDVILRADGQPVGTPQDLQQILDRRNFGTQLRLDIQRKGQPKQVYAIVLERPEGDADPGRQRGGGMFGSPSMKPENLAVQFSYVDANGEKQTFAAENMAELGQRAQKDEAYRNQLQKIFQDFSQYKDGLVIHLRPNNATKPAGTPQAAPNP